MTGDVSPESIGLSFRPHGRPSVAHVVLDGEAVLYEEDTGQTHLLNPTATVLWQCFDGTSTLDELIRDLADAYEADATVIGEDVLGLVREIGRRGLLQGVAADQPIRATNGSSVDVDRPDDCAD